MSDSKGVKALPAGILQLNITCGYKDGSGHGRGSWWKLEYTALLLCGSDVSVCGR